MSQILQGEGLVGLREIGSAARRLAGIAIPTPLIDADSISERVDAHVRLKCECLQRGGSFKIRGAHNFVSQLSDDQVAVGLVTYSSGNHAQAVALVSKLLGVKATLVMPNDAPAAKLAATRGYGAEVIQYDRYGGDREEIGERLVRERGALLVPPFDDPLIMAGAGTATAEFLEEVPGLDFLLVPVSGGGLIAGSATAAKHVRPQITVYGVEPETANDVAQSLEKGERVTISVPRTVADGLQVACVGRLTFPIIQRTVSRVLLVSDAEMIETLSWTLERMKVLVEPSGIAGAAAVRHRKADFAGRRVGVIWSGGNLDPGRLAMFFGNVAT